MGIDEVEQAATGQPVVRRREPRAVFIAVSVWRLILAGVAWTGLLLGMTRADQWRWSNLVYWSQFSTLLVALTATGSLLAPLLTPGLLERSGGYLRGAATTYSTITLVIFPVLLSGTYDDLDGQLMHLVVPVLALLDWLCVGRNQAGVRWFGPLLWLVVPLLYLPAYMLRSDVSGPLYSFLDPGRDDFARWVLTLLAAILVTGYLLVAIGRARTLLLPGTARRDRA